MTFPAMNDVHNYMLGDRQVAKLMLNGVQVWPWATTGSFLVGLVSPDPPISVPPTGAPTPGAATGGLMSTTSMVGEPPGTTLLASGVQLPAGYTVTDAFAATNSGSGGTNFGGPGLYARVWVNAVDAPDLSTAEDAYAAATMANWDSATAVLLGISVSDSSGVLVFAEAYNDTGGAKDITDGFIQVFWSR